jgi:O-antigen ligase
VRGLRVAVVPSVPVAASSIVYKPVRALWRRPVWAVVGTILLVAVPYHTGQGGSSAAHVTFADVGAVVLVAVVGLRLALTPDRRRLRSWVMLPLVAVAFAVVVAGAVNSDDASWSGVVRYLEVFVLVPGAVYVALVDESDLELVLRAVIALALVEGATGVWQYLSGSGAALGSSATRAVGTFGGDDVIAMSEVVTFGLLAGLALAVTATGRRARLGAAVAACLVVPLAMSLSRGSWLAAGCSCLLVLLLVDWRRGVAVAAAGAVALVVVIGIQGPNGALVKRFDSALTSANHPGESVQNRYRLWETAVNIWEHYPVVGVGPKAFPDYRDRYASRGLIDTADVSDASGFRRIQLLTPHSLYFLFLAEMGVLGLAALLSLVVMLICGCTRAVRAGPPEGVPRSFVLFALGFVLAYALNSVYEDIGGPTTVLEAVLVGGGLWATRQGSRRRRPASAAAVAVP